MPSRRGKMPGMKHALTAFCLLHLAAGTASAEPSLTLPIDCRLGDSCYIQSYVDRDATEAARDVTCGPQSYDGHKGTDFALPSLTAMEAGVDVLAPASGTVRATRDGMPDRLLTPDTEAEIEGRECGNGVVIDHGDGWETQVCHLRQGSVAVDRGDRVDSGTLLGEVGLSGRTQFPHVHLSVRRDGAVVDPFAPDAALDSCDPAPPARTLWAEPVAVTPGGLVAAGFAGAVPSFDAVKAGTAGLESLAPGTPAIVLWVLGHGSREGDVIEIAIDGPTGRFFETSTAIDRTQALWFRAAGRRMEGNATPEGPLTGRITLRRDGAEIDRIETDIPIR